MIYPSCSVIIPVYNAVETLALCLESIRLLEYPDDLLEIIVVDNGSTDDSVEIARQFNVTLLSETAVQSSYAARNTGIGAARGELIAFTDSDCIVTSGWLKHIVAYWDDDTIGCFAGEIEAYRPESLVEKFSDRAGTLRQGNTLNCPYLPYVQTANAAYRKSVFDRVGLFVPEMTSGGDADISWRMQKELGLKIKFIPEALVYHRHRSSIQGLFNQYRKYEYGKVFWSHHYPEYQLPSFEERKKEFEQRLRQLSAALSDNIVPLTNGEIDFTDYVSPFLRFLMAAGTYSARIDSARELGGFGDRQPGDAPAALLSTGELKVIIGKTGAADRNDDSQTTGLHHRPKGLRQRLVPHNSKRALLMEMAAVAAKDPKSVMKNLTISNLRVFFKEIKNFEPSAFSTEIKNKIYQRGTYAEEISASNDFDYFEMFETKKDDRNIFVAGGCAPDHERDFQSPRLFTLLTMLNELRYRVTFCPDTMQLQEPFLSGLVSAGIQVVSGDADMEEHFRHLGPSYAAVILSGPESAFNFISLARAYAVNSMLIFDAGDIHWPRLRGEVLGTGDTKLWEEAEAIGKTEMLKIGSSDVIWTSTQSDKEFLLGINPELSIDVVSDIDMVTGASGKIARMMENILQRSS